jgi:hypothetical protein
MSSIHSSNLACWLTKIHADALTHEALTVLSPSSLQAHAATVYFRIVSKHDQSKEWPKR